MLDSDYYGDFCTETLEHSDSDGIFKAFFNQYTPGCAYPHRKLVKIIENQGEEELEVLSKTNFENIMLARYSLCSLGGQKVLMIVEESIEGSLYQFIKNTQVPVPLECLTELFLDLAKALDYLNKKDRYHDDLKPGNILRCQGDNLRILSVGKSKIGRIYECPYKTSIYMSPNSSYQYDWENPGIINYEKDNVWSFGKIIYELCVLEVDLDFRYYSEQELMQEIKENFDKRNYPKHFIEMVRNMLKPCYDDRLDIRQVIDNLSYLLNNF